MKKEAILKEHLAAMLRIDRELYEKILDTPNFAFHFNEICNMAIDYIIPPQSSESKKEV